MHAFIEEVGEDFESNVIIGEGEYGKFFTIPELENLPYKTTHLGRLVVEQLNEVLEKGI